MHQESLHLDADLSGVGKRSPGDPGRHLGQVLHVRMHDGGGVAPELQHHSLATGHGLEVPADLSAPGEAQQGEGLVPGQPLGDGDGEMQHLQRARWSTALSEQLRQVKGRERGLRRWLEHHGVSRGQCGSDFVGH